MKQVNFESEYKAPTCKQADVRAVNVLCGSFDAGSIKKGNTDWWIDDED